MQAKNGSGHFLATFECPGCMRKWKSGNSWKNICRICKHIVEACHTEKVNFLIKIYFVTIGVIANREVQKYPSS